MAVRQRKRRTQEERSRTTIEQLLSATTSILADKGMVGITTDEISSRAGVSNGARAHHFKAKADLIIAAFEFTYSNAKNECVAASIDVTPKNVVDEFIVALSDVYFGLPFRAYSELAVSARKNSELKGRVEPILEDFVGNVEKAWHQAFIRSGYPKKDAELIVALTFNVVRGIALNSLWRSGRRNALLDEWKRLLKSQY